mmetsp:Transcript_19107/g.53078  ORF Transcript_19107/g.53078 Transcript_19107/m.53078 type:complete len:329 (-) Transcript_19107:68-1054(-)|eukprot:CAMPEP_0198116920 /NCGR_PEP_ID=MMETSP1442-20131203/15508_1 /TAXON_ID= /ORGANISM="Craspedostauros australis, Strain CCMP3328" /LENGTH=328 /DNA_ID=CAMNT_0043774853 /DNA_START=83 /DNA_END=1069 /DNA_ORIENTATION=-
MHRTVLRCARSTQRSSILPVCVGARTNEAQANHLILEVPASRRLASSSSTTAEGVASPTSATLPPSSDIPFYGQPRPDNGTSVSSIIARRVSIALHSAVTAFNDPIRGDAVAALGDVTGATTLKRLRDEMMAHPDGKRVLIDRPIVSKDTIPVEEFMQEGKRILAEDPNVVASINGHLHGNKMQADDITFGQAYGIFLASHDYDPDERAEVRYVEDEELAYVMLRYRQCHDYWHALTGLPPTVLGELGLKWLELFQTGLPIAALSSTVGSLRLNAAERRILTDQYLPWAHEQSSGMTTGLMNVYYENEFDTPLADLRARINIQPAPKV